MAKVRGYHSTIPRLEDVGNTCVGTPCVNFTPYNLFCLRTRLYPYIRKTYGPDTTATFEHVEDSGVMSLVATLKNPDGSTKKMTTEQEKDMEKHINVILADDLDHVLVIPTDFPFPLREGKCADSIWLKSVLPYLYVDDEYYPYIDEYGLNLILDSVPEYTDLYADVINDLVDQLLDMMHQGYIIGMPEDIAKSWKFSLLDEDYDVYYATWSNNFITGPYGDMYGFIKSRIKGETSIDVHVGSNLVERHLVAESIKNAKFISDYVRVDVNGLDDALEKISVIRSSLDGATGNVVILKSLDIEEAKEKRTASEELGYRTVTYITLFGYVTSMYMSKHIDHNLIKEEIQNKIKSSRSK